MKNTAVKDLQEDVVILIRELLINTKKLEVIKSFMEEDLGDDEDRMNFIDIAKNLAFRIKHDAIDVERRASMLDEIKKIMSISKNFISKNEINLLKIVTELEDK